MGNAGKRLHRREPPAPTYADYRARREEYAAGRASLDDLMKLVTPDVARQISVAEHAEAGKRREDAERARLAAALAARSRRRERWAIARGVAGTLALATAMTLTGMAWVHLITAMDRGHPAALAPVMRVTHTGPGELVLTSGDGQSTLIAVQDVAEETDGFMTRLPVRYLDEAGHVHSWRGMYQFYPPFRH